MPVVSTCPGAAGVALSGGTSASALTICKHVDMNDLLRDFRGRSQVTESPSMGTPSDHDVQRWTAELNEALEADDLQRAAFAKARLNEALLSERSETHQTSFSGGVQRPVESPKTPGAQMADLLRRRRDGR